MQALLKKVIQPGKCYEQSHNDVNVEFTKKEKGKLQ